MEEDIKVLEKELANIRNLIDYYAYEALDLDKQIRMQRFKKAIENLIARNKKLEEHCKQLIKEKQELTTIAEEDVLSIECVNKNYIPKSKVIEIIEKYYNEHGDTKEEITKFIEKLLQEGDKI